MGGATLGLGPKALMKSKRSPYERFVGMRLSGGRSGGCFQYTRGERAKERRAVKHKTSEARRGDGFHDLQDKTLNTRLGIGVVDRRECGIVDYSLYFMMVTSG